MTLLETIRSDLIDARKSHNDVVSNALRTVVAECENEASRRKTARVLTDAEVVHIVSSLVKNIEETKNLIMSDPQRLVEVDKLGIEAAHLIRYLPQQLSEDEIRAIITQQISLGSVFGKIMGHFKADYAGKYDAGQVAGIVKQMID